MAVKEKRLIKDKAERGKHFRELASKSPSHFGEFGRATTATGTFPTIEYQTVDVSGRRRMVIEVVPAGPDDTADLPSLRRQRLLEQLSELDLDSCDKK